MAHGDVLIGGELGWYEHSFDEYSLEQRKGCGGLTI